MDQRKTYEPDKMIKQVSRFSRRLVQTHGFASGQELPTRLPQDAADLVDLGLRRRPVALGEGVARAREEGRVVAGPLLRREDDVLELLAAGQLHKN